MVHLVLSSSAPLVRLLAVVLLLVVSVAPVIAAQPKANDGTLTVRNGNTTLSYLRARGDRGRVLTYEIVQQGSKGTVTLPVGNRLGVIMYARRRDINPVGTDQFTFRVSDNTGAVSNLATVKVAFVNNTVLSWTQPAAFTYGSAISVPATATAGGEPVPGTYVYTPPLGTVLPAGNTRIEVAFTPADGSRVLTEAKTAKVAAATLTVTSTATKVYGSALPALTPTYTGFVASDTAAGVLTGSPALSTSAIATSPVGNHPITVNKGSLKADKNYSLQYVAGVLSVTPANATISLSNLSHTYDSLGHGALITTAPAGLAAIVTYDGSTLLPVDAGTYPVVATIDDPNYQGSAVGTLVINQAAAAVTLGELIHTYDSTAHSATVTTVPAGLTVVLTYGGETAVPVDAGTYAVQATISEVNYSGSANGALVINKGVATVALGDLEHTYDGTGHMASVTTAPPALPVILSYNASDVLPVNAGGYDVVATVDHPNYLGSAGDVLIITKAVAQVTLGDLAHIFDGNPHTAAISTVPAGLAVTVTYEGIGNGPTIAGNYAVVATVTDANHQGMASALLKIDQAPQTITMAPLNHTMVGDPDQPLSASSTSGLPVGFTVSGPAEIVGSLLHVTGPGEVIVTATQTGDANWAGAAPVVQSISVAPEPGGGLLASYFANTSLSGLPVLSRIDSQVDFDWALGSPASGVVPNDLFSARWDGEIEPRFSETYTITLRTDDGVRVWLGTQLVIDSWNDRSAADSSFSFAAVAGQRYRIRIEYYEKGGLAVAKLLWRSASEPSATIPSRQLHPTEPDTSGPIGTGSGLTGSYFNNETLSGVPAVSRIDAGVNFDWFGGSPASGINSDSFSARWTGDIQPRYSEPYTVILRTDDGVRMWLDGQLVINDWILRGPANSSYTFNAQAGQRYRIHIEYYEHLGSAVAQLQWFSAREFAGPVPASQLYPLPPPTVQVAEVGYAVAEREPVALTATIGNANPDALLYTWTNVSGPAPASFQPANHTSTVARFPQAGTYEVALSVFNGHVVTSDHISVIVQESDITTDLVAHYTFDEGAGSLALDASGMHHTGTLSGGAWESPGKSGGALRFDGVAQVNVNAATTLDVMGTQPLTLAVWMKSDRSFVDMTAPWAMPIYKAFHDSSQGYALMVTYTDTNFFGLRMLTGNGFGQRQEAAVEEPGSGAWVQFTGVYDGSSVAIYRNGVLAHIHATGAVQISPATLAPLVLGRGFEGLLDDIRIYRRGLSRVDVFGLVQEDHQRALPTVDAGADQVATLLAPSLTLAGNVSGDHSGWQKKWRQVSGPVLADIANPTTLTPTLTFSTAGDYRFELQVYDGVVVGRDAMDVAVSAGAVDLSTGLVLHYRLDEASGTLALDSSLNSLTGTLTGDAAFTLDGHLAGGLHLGGTGKVTTPGATPINTLSQMSLSLWMKPTRTLAAMTTPAALGLYHADYATNRGYGFMAVAVDSNLFGLRLHTGTGRKEVTALENSAGQWLHYVGTYDGNDMRLYRNGEQVNINRTGAFTVPALNVPLRVGEGFEGAFDDVRIYNRALLPIQVRALHLIPPAASNG